MYKNCLNFHNNKVLDKHFEMVHMFTYIYSTNLIIIHMGIWRMFALLCRHYKVAKRNLITKIVLFQIQNKYGSENLIIARIWDKTMIGYLSTYIICWEMNSDELQY